MTHADIDAAALAVVALILYLLPSAIAVGRGHHQRNPIVLVNVLLGWTLIGWLWALIWSVSAVRRPA